MEKTKTLDFSNRPNDVKDGTWVPHCSFWFFGNEDSADYDLKEKFEIIE